MPKLKHDEALRIIDFLHAQYRHAGSKTSTIQAYDSFVSYILKESKYSLDSIETWEIPGLFVAHDDIQKSVRPNVIVIYKMGCGTLVSLMLPKIHGYPPYLSVQGKVFKGELGFVVDRKHWQVLGNVNELVLKQGKKRATHLSRKSAVAV